MRMSESEEESSGGEDWPVTADWLEATLTSYHRREGQMEEAAASVAVAEFSVRPGCEAGESVLSDILAVRVLYRVLPPDGTEDEPRALDLIVKLLPNDPFSRFFVTEAQRTEFNAILAPQTVWPPLGAQRCSCVFNLISVTLRAQSPESRENLSAPSLPRIRTEVSQRLLEAQTTSARPSNIRMTDVTTVVPELEQFQRRLLSADESPLELPIPRCYHAHYAAPGEDAEGSLSESVLVLENLKSRGFRGADFSRGLTLREARAALEAVARLHALSLALKVREGRPLDERYPFLFQTARATDSYQQLVERGLPQLARFLERRPGLEAVLQSIAKLRPSTKELIASLLAPQEPMALITHTDFWCNNLLFRDEGDDERCACAVLDWQMVTYSRPTNDLALLLVSSLPTELRRRCTPDLLDRYWAELTATSTRLGVDVEGDLGYARDQLAEDYRRSQLLALLLCIGSVDVALGNALTEQRLVDVLQDLHQDGVLSPDLLAQ
uniref:(California timema) hypothetical protein n=1 Tax=Timema californicum TaxID=61474 RepID=A0A7R9J9A4_TIMCA|nr:unnamed protein product [Timema californicum]